MKLKKTKNQIEFAKKWAKALRSGKYKQIKGALFDFEGGDINKVCGIGCALRVVGETSYTIGNIETYVSYSKLMREWRVKIPEYLQKKIGYPCKSRVVSDLNDAYDFTFDEIADCVEYTYGNKECIINKYKENK